MIKGVYKEFITVKIKDNPIYEEAIFILNCASSSGNSSKKDNTRENLLFEANRILCEQGVKKPRRRRKIFKKILFSVLLLLLGGFSGALITFFLLS